MNTHYPLVSVVIPAYNAEAFIEATLTSVLKQTYQQLEILVVDDGSSDRTAELVEAIAKLDRRVVLLQQANSGVAAARNLGIRQAKGEFIAPLDADDIWYPQNLEKQVKCMVAAGEKVGLVYAWSIDIDEFGQPMCSIRASRIEGNVYTTLLLHDFIANASSVLIRKAYLDQVGGYDTTLKQPQGQGCEDWDLYLRIAEYYEFRVVPMLLIGYRKLPGSMSTDSGQMAHFRLLIWKKVRQRYPRIPSLMERLSNSSFYMHLAYQNYQYSKHQAALAWIVQALKIDPVTPFLRLGLYKITVLSLLRLSVNPTQQTSDLKQRSIQHSNAAQPILLPPRSGLVTQPKILGEILIHWFASLLFGTSEKWL